MNHDRIKSDAYLARHADRKAGNEASFVWMFAWGILSVASFPVRWSFNLHFISIPMALAVSFVLAAVLGAVWYVRATKDIEGAKAEYHRRRREQQQTQRDAHLAKLRSAVERASGGA